MGTLNVSFVVHIENVVYPYENAIPWYRYVLKDPVRTSQSSFAHHSGNDVKGLR
jgi:hypothetical protein